MVAGESNAAIEYCQYTDILVLSFIFKFINKTANIIIVYTCNLNFYSCVNELGCAFRARTVEINNLLILCQNYSLTTYEEVYVYSLYCF